MRALVQETARAYSPERLVERFGQEQGIVLLRSSLPGMDQARYSFVAARPFLSFRSAASCCELRRPGRVDLRFGEPWRVLEELLSRYELHDEIDLPFPLGGCFGFWGYDLKNFVEPRLSRRAINDLEIPDCHLGFYDSLVAFDHHLGKSWVIATGLESDGSRNPSEARKQSDFWFEQLRGCEYSDAGARQSNAISESDLATLRSLRSDPALSPIPDEQQGGGMMFTNVTREAFLSRVRRAQAYIRSGDIYQVNLSQRLTVPFGAPGWRLFQALNAVSPAPFSAYFDAGEFQIASSSPELFLRLSDSQIQTRPIKGTRPRSSDPTCDSQLSYQLQTSPKEMAELVMITDLLRNDLGKVCEFGSVHVPELVRLERFAQVQHLVSTVEGVLRSDVTHLGALAACFPGGSITGAPKVRAMEIIDELETVRRGPYTGALGYLGFNRQSQFSMIIRTGLVKEGLAHFQVGAGIVADSEPEAEFLETLAKARGFIEALRFCSREHDRLPQWQIRS